MRGPLRQVIITVISPDTNDVGHASFKAAEFIHNLSPWAMITIEISAEIPASEEEKASES